MKKNISLLITLFIASTLLVAAKPLVKKTKPVDKSKETQLNKVKPIIDEVAARKIVKPMKKKPRKPSEVQTELELLREKFEHEKLLIINGYKEDLKMLKSRKHEALNDLKTEYKKKRAFFKK